MEKKAGGKKDEGGRYIQGGAHHVIPRGRANCQTDDAVVRGYSYTIRYMNIESPAEMSQDAKDAFREAATAVPMVPWTYILSR